MPTAGEDGFKIDETKTRGGEEDDETRNNDCSNGRSYSDGA